MTSTTARNAAALIERNGSTLPKATPAPKAPKAGKAEAPAPTPAPAKATAPTQVTCGCGCGETANIGRTYRPGHDARHAGQVGRWLAENPKAAPAEVEAAIAALPTAKLQEKARKFAENRAAEATRKAAAKRIREAAKAALAAELAAL